MTQYSIQHRARARVYSTNVMRCSLCCPCDLLERHFSGLLVHRSFHQPPPRFSPEVKSQDIQSGKTQPYFRGWREMCVFASHTWMRTHTHADRGARRLVYWHTQTEERGAGGEVAGQGDGVRQDHGMFDKETGTRCWVSVVVMFGVWMCVGVCVYTCLWQTPWGVADRHQLPVNNVGWTSQNGFTAHNNWCAGI